jgi:hypothetical protein
MLETASLTSTHPVVESRAMELVNFLHTRGRLSLSYDRGKLNHSEVCEV